MVAFLNSIGSCSIFTDSGGNWFIEIRTVFKVLGFIKKSLIFSCFNFWIFSVICRFTILCLI